MNKAIFLDRDGTLNEEVDYLTKVQDLKIIDGVKEALENFKRLGFLNIIITNQAGIARGYLTEDDLEIIHDELKASLTVNGMNLIDDIFYSPFHTDGIIHKFKTDSEDRKPNTGMIRKAISKHNISPQESFLIGDSFTDMQCAVNAGLKKILVKTGYGKRDEVTCIKENLHPEYIAKDLLDASKYIGLLELNN